MNEEPSMTPISDDDNLPLTKGDIKSFVRKEVDDLKQFIIKQNKETRDHFDAVETRLETRFTEVLDHFDAVAENIHKDVAGANRDEINLLNNQVPDHEDRIVDLEDHAGLPVGPRHKHIA